MERIYAKYSISVSEARSQLSKLIDDSNNEVVAILQRSKVKAYLVNPDVFEKIIKQIENKEFLKSLNL